MELKQATYPEASYFTGSVSRVKNPIELQDALDTVKDKGTIIITDSFVLLAGAKLRERDDDGWVRIIGDRYDVLPDQRVTASTDLGRGIHVSDNTSAFIGEEGASGYVFGGLDIIAGGVERVWALLDLQLRCKDIHIDRCRFTGEKDIDTVRGVWSYAENLSCIKSHFSEIASTNYDSQAFIFSEGPGPVLFEDNFASAAGENLLSGGEKVTTPDNTSDITIVNNHFWKDPAWDENNPNYDGRRRIIKNNIEFKRGEKILIKDNLFENNYKQGDQEGYMLLLTPRNQYGDDTLASIQDVLVESNTFINGPRGIQMSSSDNERSSGVSTARITFKDNVFTGLYGGEIYEWPAQVQLYTYNEREPFEDITFEGNTFVTTTPDQGSFMTFSPTPVEKIKRLTVVDNTFDYGRFGFFTDGDLPWMPLIDELTYERNTLVGRFAEDENGKNYLESQPVPTRQVHFRWDVDGDCTSNTLRIIGPNGPVDIELDGQLPDYVIGLPEGDYSWQLIMTSGEGMTVQRDGTNFTVRLEGPTPSPFIGHTNLTVEVI